MKEIVIIENNELVVSVEDIVKFSGNAYKSVRRLILNNEDKFELLGLKVKQHKEILNRLYKMKLNEEQTTFLFILMRNTPQILEFKFNLVRQFMQLKDMVCETNKIQLESKNNQLLETRLRLKEAKRKMYAHPRNGNSETVTRIISDYGIEISAADLNMILVGKKLLTATAKKGFDFSNENMSGNTPLLHIETVLNIVDEVGITRRLGQLDLTPSLFEDYLGVKVGGFSDEQ